MAVAEYAVQNEVRPEEGPLALDVLKQLQLCRLVVQTVRILTDKNTKKDIRFSVAHFPLNLPQNTTILTENVSG